jgi:hypothetical protein
MPVVVYNRSYEEPEAYRLLRTSVINYYRHTGSSELLLSTTTGIQAP